MVADLEISGLYISVSGDPRLECPHECKARKRGATRLLEASVWGARERARSYASPSSTRAPTPVPHCRTEYVNMEATWCRCVCGHSAPVTLGGLIMTRRVLASDPGGASCAAPA